VRPAARECAADHFLNQRLEAIDALIDRLARSEVAECAYNQYGLRGQPERARANGLRRENLRRYLQQMTGVGPKALLVGEAPGYRGCRLTGVPFTSERILLRRRDVVGARGACRIFGPEQGYRKTAERRKVTGEASATMVWQTIGALRPLPLLWNAFPFHPFREGQQMSNRRPTVGELASGSMYIGALSRIYDIELVVAVGTAAESALERAKIQHRSVCHPSHGGKAQFVAGLERISGDTGAF
jgi:hypothetical protein